MNIPVLVEKIDGNGYRAEGAAPFALVAEGATRAEALGKLRDLIQARLAAGAEVSYVPLDAPSNPWLALVGIYENDPYLNEYKQAIADYRQEVEEDPDRP